ncbi:unnamed protein product, partial [Tetraodon nigroviridis]
REVTCVVKSDDSPAEDAICEYFEPRPHLEQACLIPCPQDCIVSEYSPWTSCSKTCGTGLRNRIRRILVPPRFGGIACPNLTEFRSCKPEPCNGPEGLYSLRVEPWSPCVLPNTRPTRQVKRRNGKSQSSNRKAGVTDPKSRELTGTEQTRNRLNWEESSTWDIQVGYQTRNVTCVHRNGSSVERNLCTLMDLPTTVRPCLLPKDCQVSEWTEWSLCSKTCTDFNGSKGNRTRKRQVLQLPVGEEQDCPPLEETESCEPPRETSLPCANYTWRTTEWSDCSTDSLLSQQDNRRSSRNVTGLCGGGLQTRDLYCVQTNAELLNYLSEFREKDKVGQSQRQQKPSAPPLLSITFQITVPCPVECEVSPWGAWGPCTFENCDDQAGTKGEEVDRTMCASSPDLGPVLCEVPCSRDCVLSDWTSWSTCSQTCSSKTMEGKQMRMRSILAYNAGEGGAQCPNSSALQEVRNCNEHACTVYRWQAGPWGLCAENTSPSSGNTTRAQGPCLRGLQTRKVICVRAGVGQVPPKKCSEGSRPSSARACALCRKDCIVTPFSDWTPCPVTCDAAGNVVKLKQFRKRLIIQQPSNGGRECPKILQEQRDCELPETCPGFRWKTHKWSKCHLAPWLVRQNSSGAQETCGAGLQTRALSCFQLNGTQADVSDCLKFTKAMPSIAQPCQLPCQDDCQLTNWSKFSSCTVDCVGVRIRKRTLIGRSKKKDKCKNTQMYPLSETQYCPCNKYNAWPVGNWSDCILPKRDRLDNVLGLKVPGDIKQCGQGYRYQAMACYDQDNRLVETARCNSHGYIEEACSVPCPSDCKLSEWSNWSRCSKSCGSGVKVRSKWLREKRYNGGRPCPKLDQRNQLYEVVPCRGDCNQYVWVAEPWSLWKVSHMDLKQNCGEGVQTRKVRCLLNTVDGPSEAVENYLCDPERMPLGTRASQLPCPDNCVLGDWGPWSPCSLPCTRANNRVRSRYVLRQPTQGRKCPDLLDKEPCSLNLNCFNYFYNITEWSTCQLSPNAMCGDGIKTRMLDCVRSDGKSVDLKHCQKLNLEASWQLNLSCVVECPVNCQLSEWSDWSTCSQTCGLKGKMSRQRWVVQASQGDGRPCPSQMAQWKPCPVQPCYQWKYSSWSQCQVENVVCGTGTRYRNLSCVVSDGSFHDEGSLVDDELCQSLELTVNGFTPVRLKEACTLPCPGDCYLMEWSDWSSCAGVCVRGAALDYVSVQVRSRAVLAQEPENLQLCPDQQWESRPCTGGKCYDYKWLRGLNSSSPAVWCQRSDGVNVTGGCPGTSPPAGGRSCDPPCLTPKSRCGEDGVCTCEQGFTEVFLHTGQLTQCAPTPILEIPTWEDKKGDVKTIRAIDTPSPTSVLPGLPGRTWYLQPYGPDGKLKIWVYGVAVGAFVLFIFIVSVIYLACKQPKSPQRQSQPSNQLKPLSLAYDGDTDM